MSCKPCLLSKAFLAFLILSLLMEHLVFASPQSLLDEAKASMNADQRTKYLNRNWTQIAYTEAHFEGRVFGICENPNPASAPHVIEVPLPQPLQPGLLWVIFYSKPHTSGFLKNNLGGGIDWSSVGNGVWGFIKPMMKNEPGYGQAESIRTFILRPHLTVTGFNAEIHVETDVKGVCGGTQRGGNHSLKILFSPDNPTPPPTSTGGYQLYFNDRLVSGPDAATYTRKQAQDNCDWNSKDKPTIAIRCVYDGTTFFERLSP